MDAQSVPPFIDCEMLEEDAVDYDVKDINLADQGKLKLNGLKPQCRSSG